MHTKHRPNLLIFLALSPLALLNACPPNHNDTPPQNSTPTIANSQIPTGELSSKPPIPAPNASSLPEKEQEIDLSQYPWHADPTVAALPPHDTLLHRVSTSDGFVRVPVEAESFGAWLRLLPLAAPETPVLSYAGSVVRPVGHPNLAAVATLDVGNSDLQQCADAVMRLHGEWLWSRGKRNISFRAASGLELPFERWVQGDRVVAQGSTIKWEAGAGTRKNDHSSFRRYMDMVFSWANTASLERQGEKIPLAQIQPGDFFVTAGNPGHTVLVLDIAKNDSGEVEVLLGQSYMPAQNFHVLRPRRDTAWFAIDPASDGLQTPFWPKPFPWSSLRRLTR